MELNWLFDAVFFLGNILINYANALKERIIGFIDLLDGEGIVGD